MILTGPEIIAAVQNGEILINPFEINSVNPNSIDLKLGNVLIEYLDKIIDPSLAPSTRTIPIPETGYLLNSGEFRLGSSHEIVGSNKYVPIIHGKSGIARAGLFVHVTADLIDIGSVGNLTFQLFATLPIRIYKGMAIAQISFWRTLGEVSLYTGKYQGSTGPQPSKAYQDEFWTKERN